MVLKSIVRHSLIDIKYINIEYLNIGVQKSEKFLIMKIKKPQELTSAPHTFNRG